MSRGRGEKAEFELAPHGVGLRLEHFLRVGGFVGVVGIGLHVFGGGGVWGCGGVFSWKGGVCLPGILVRWHPGRCPGLSSAAPSGLRS